MTAVERRNVLGTVGVGTGFLFSLLLMPSYSDAALVDFQFDGGLSEMRSNLAGSGRITSHGFNIGPSVSDGSTFGKSIEDNTSHNMGRHILTIQSPLVSTGTRAAMPASGTSSVHVSDGLDSDAYERKVNGLATNTGMNLVANDVRIDLSDHDGRVFSNDHLLTSPPSVSSFAQPQWRLIFEVDGRYTQRGLNSHVPLPASVWLFGAGLVALVGLGSRGLTHHIET
ncbi:MAG TPA: VPLPA-CTERM sorting domain-containing protein [Nitrospira sp.]|nr:VPLPA-CTERM sorting domain-containing protein [Nitrospira sp.]